uniref:protein disulfide-isomerase n=1 Tax=Eptatretus burgeri TaxID=7764 RepID=A0A8C4QKT0_EPTBU
MWRFTVALLALAALASASDVLEFTDNDFANRIIEHDMALVEFFAPWCGHCKRLAPDYEKAATKLKDIVALVKVCQSSFIYLVMLLQLCKAGTAPRQWHPTYSDLKTVGYFFSIRLVRPSICLVGFFEKSGSVSEAEFLKLAAAQRDNYRFAHTFVPSLLEKQGGKEVVVIFRPKHLANKFEESTVVYNGEITSPNLKEFVQDQIFGLCPHMTEDNKDRMKGKDLMVAYYDVDYEKNAKGSNYWRNRVMRVAKHFADEGQPLQYAIGGFRDFASSLSEFGLDGAGDLPLVTIRTVKGEKYVMKEEFTRDGKSLERFLQSYFDGELKPYLKSEAVPESNDGPVKTVVAESFDEIVNDESKDVLIEFYAPWCGHCKSLEPKYTELGEKLANDQNIIIAKMDATSNDVPAQYDVKGFPTIYFSPMGSKDSPKKYEGGREIEDFISYLKREATVQPVVVDESKKKKKKQHDKEDL